MVKNLPAMQETWVQSLGQEDPLEEGMATHSCILAWRIPWTEEPGGLWSIESQRVGHVSTLTHIYIIQENPSLLRFLAFLVAQMVKNLPAMQETWVQSLGWEDPLEKGTAAHTIILAWKIPGTEEPGGLQSMGSQRVGHD